jgi:single-strand DNA-binding protein
MMHAAAHGRLGGDPRSIATKSGKAMTTARMAVQLDPADDSAMWLDVVCFGNLADLLLRHSKGETIAVSGRLQRRSWADKQTGKVREQLSIVADSIVSARSVRPITARRKGDGGKPTSSHAPERRAHEAPFHDDHLDNLPGFPR